MDTGTLAPILILPDAPFYIVLAILIAVTVIVAADIRDESQLLPNRVVNGVALLLWVGSWITIIPIMLVIINLNEFNSLSHIGAWGMICHTIALAILLVVITIWYVSIAIFKPTVPGVPTTPPQHL